MPPRKKVNLESLLTPEDLEKLKEIRFPNIPEQIEEIGDGASAEVFLYKMEDGTLRAGKKPKISLLNKSVEETESIQKVITIADPENTGWSLPGKHS